MIDTSKIKCPQRKADLEAGYVSFGSELLWHKAKLGGYRRIFLHAFATGEPIVGTWISSGLMSSVRAMKCSACGTIVMPRVAPPS